MMCSFQCQILNQFETHAQSLALYKQQLASMFNGFMSFTVKYQRRPDLPRKMKCNSKEYLFVKNNQCKQLGNHQSLVPKVHLVSKYISPVQLLKLFIPLIDCSCNSPQPSNHGQNFLFPFLIQNHAFVYNQLLQSVKTLLLSLSYPLMAFTSETQYVIGQFLLLL